MSDLLLAESVAGAGRERFTATINAPNIWSIERWDSLIAQMRVTILERQNWAPHTLWTFQNVLTNLKQVEEELTRRVGPEIVEGTFERLSIQLESAKTGKLGWRFYALQC